jgi:hypothetical protein
VTFLFSYLSFNNKFWKELIHLLSYISHLSEVLELTLMELNLNELTLTSFNSIQLNLTEFTAVKNLVGMITMEHKHSELMLARLT